MASGSKLTIRVTAARGSSKITYSTNGRYVSFTTAGLTNELLKQPILPTSTLAGFWLAVLALVQADITSAE